MPTWMPRPDFSRIWIRSECGFRLRYPLVPAPCSVKRPCQKGPRPVVLFRYAEGRPPNPDSVEDARAQGVTLARIHAAAERFPGRQAGRYRLDLDHLLHRQVAAVMELKEVKEETRRYLSELSSRLDASVEALPDLN